MNRDTWVHIVHGDGGEDGRGLRAINDRLLDHTPLSPDQAYDRIKQQVLDGWLEIAGPGENGPLYQVADQDPDHPKDRVDNEDRERIRTYAANHPGADHTEVLTALVGDLEADFARAQELIEDVLKSTTPPETNVGGGVADANNRTDETPDDGGRTDDATAASGPTVCDNDCDPSTSGDQTHHTADSPTIEQNEHEGDGLPSYDALFRAAQNRAGRADWEYVEEGALEAVLDEYGLADFLTNGTLARADRWRRVDLSGGGEPPDLRWYYATGGEPRPDEFRRFHELLTEAATDGYTPYYFRVERAGKAPATQYGSWKDEQNRLTVDEATDWMERGGNVGIAGTPDDALVNVDIDDDEETTPADIPESLRARSRSRSGWHTWFFDPNNEIPNIPTDTVGEVRTDWQYVVAPGSFVASAREELPADADDCGYYTIETPVPVATIGYDDLPTVFREFHETARGEATGDDATGDTPLATDIFDDCGTTQDGGAGERTSEVFDVDAATLVGNKDPSDRFASVFHDSSTDANMSLSNKGRLQCWRHNVAHGGLQALAVLSDRSGGGDAACRQLGEAHKISGSDKHNHSGAGSNQLKGDWRLVWYAWDYAKREGIIPDDDPIPYRVLVGLVVRDGRVGRDDLVERAADTGRVVDDGVDADRDTYTALPPGTYNDALDHIREQYGVNPGRGRIESRDADDSGAGGQRWDWIKSCTPPELPTEAADVDTIRDTLRTDAYDDVVKADAPVVWAHDPGVGKTTTAHHAADQRDRPLSYLFDKHRKAHEHRDDDPTPAVDLHLRGANQPRHDVCARAAYETDTEVWCPDHGDPRDCPRMCPVYDLDPDDPDREAFEALVAEIGPVRAHVILDPHDGDECPWLSTLRAADDVTDLVGVHEYQRLKTVCDGRDILVDESPGELADDRRLGVEDLVNVARMLDNWHGQTAGAETLRRFARFASDVIGVVAGTDAAPDSLAALDPPTPVWDAYESRGPVAGGYMEYVEPDEHWQLTEALVRAKREFVDHLLQQIHDDQWDGTPLCFDTLLAAAAEAGLDETAVREAAGRQTLLNACPVCGADLDHVQGRRLCGGCGWDEREDLYTAGDCPSARILAWVDHTPGADPPTALARRRLPAPADLPDSPLVLDATATPEKIATFYGVDEDQVTVHGDQQHALNDFHLTQILDAQYHYSTLETAVEEDRPAAERIQNHLDMVGDLHERPLIVSRQETRRLFNIPDNAVFLHFHGGRGLNFEGCDAVVVVGAPHPNMEDIRRTAELLAQGRDDVRIGGDEHSTRPDADHPPVYRKLRYEDDNGDGRAVATKHYTGLVGALFREAREKELEQLSHRIRPILADDIKNGHLLTNVPTDLPVDEVCSLEELADPPKALFPVDDGALDLANVLADVAAGEGVEGFRAGTFVETDGDTIRFKIRKVTHLAHVAGLNVSERTIRRWIDDLEDIGLVNAGDYIHRAGVEFSTDGSTLTRALSVLTSNAGVEVAIKRRLAALATDADTAGEWLRAARGLVPLDGGGEWPPPDTSGPDPPPDPGG